MATATIRLTSDITGDALSVNETATLTKANSADDGLDQFTGVNTLYFESTQSDTNVVAAADYVDTTVAHKVYIRNASSSGFVTVDIDSSANEPLGRLYPGDWAFFPYDGTLDVDIDTSAAGMTVEVAVLSQAAVSS